MSEKKERKSVKLSSSGTASQKVRRGPGGGPPGAMPAEKAKDFKGTLRRLMKYLSGEKAKFAVVLLLTVLSSAFSVIGPKVLGLATTILGEGVMEKGFNIDFGRIGQILLIMVAMYLFSALCTFIMGLLMSGVAQKTVFTLRQDVKLKLDKLPIKFFDNNAHGDILSRVTNDMDTIAQTLQQSLTQLITSIVTIVGMFIMMLIISPILTIIALISIPLCIYITMQIAKRSQKFFRAQQKNLGTLNGHVEEMYSGHKVVKAYGQEEKSIGAFEEMNKELYGVAWKAQFLSGIMMPALNFVNNLGYVIVCIAGGFMVANGRLPIGDVQAFYQYMKQFSQPIMQTANIANIIQSTIAAAERVFEILDAEEEVPEVSPPENLSKPRGNVDFEAVKFGYSDDNILIDGMDIDVKEGQTIAIVGPTGAGKTTLVNLLMRFYEIQGGRITIDGKDISRMSRQSLHDMFGMVLQDTWLFSGTIRENIAYGKEGATEDEIRKAADAAYADKFVRKLPDGYDTLLTEDATNISQGQKQLITIARAVLKDPEILILDEATSSVDTRTEQLIQKAMNGLMEGRTSFVIAHRLSTIKNADLILVMSKGSIIEKGTHKELLAANGFYADLYNSQFAVKAQEETA